MKYGSDLTDRNQLVEGIVIELPLPKRPGSDQDLEYLGSLPFPFAPPAYLLTEPLRLNDLVTDGARNARVTLLDGLEAVVDYLSDDGKYVVGTERVLISSLTLI